MDVCKLKRVICHSDWRRCKNTGKQQQHMQEDGVSELPPQQTGRHAKQGYIFTALFSLCYSSLPSGLLILPFF